MSFASRTSKRIFTLPVTLVACLAGLSGCDKPEVPLPEQKAAPSQLATEAAALPATQPPGAPVVAATGVLIGDKVGSDMLIAAADPVKGPSCNLETIAGVNTGAAVIEVAAGSTMKVTGWMYSALSQSVPANRHLRIESEDGSAAWSTQLGGQLERPDVPQWFNIGDWALRSGFEQDVAITTLAPGRYHLLLTYTENGAVYACDNGRRISIMP